MHELVRASSLSKRYGSKLALDNVDLSLSTGKVIGLIGPNGAGKSTLLKSILGLLRYDGSLSVMGKDPHKDRARMLEEVSFIADVASLPRWIRIRQLVDYCEAVHPRFSRQRFLTFLERTEMTMNMKVSQLSKGMTTQLHLAVVMAIDAKLLILDEPTLGLDILYRKQFYTSLVSEFFDEQRTILVSTHQVEEIEHILTDLVFIQRGRIILNEEMQRIPDRFTQLNAPPEHADAARALKPIHEQRLFGQHVFIFDGLSKEQLDGMGELRTPGVADLFVAMMEDKS